ncbi:MAG: glycosyltransferase family 1 protein [Calditrichaeota bacterium]|nr:MAG: glycosyltransferase family 1 protein [Calditrichota bacterium]
MSLSGLRKKVWNRRQSGFCLSSNGGPVKDLCFNARFYYRLYKVKKTILITNIPTPYRIPLFNALGKQLLDMALHLQVVFAVKNYGRRKWHVHEQEFGFDYAFLQENEMQTTSEKAQFRYPGLFRFLIKEKPDLIIVSGFSTAAMVSWLYTKFTGVPFCIWSGEIPARGHRISRLRKMQRLWLLKSCTRCIAYGSQAKQYLMQLGVPRTRIDIAINTVDTTFFSNQVNRIRQNRNSTTKKHILAVGYMTARKNYQSFIPIFEQLVKQRDDFVVDIVGDGPERKKLEKLVHQRQLQDTLIFHGYKQREALPEFYARAAMFLFPTEFDIWGLVLVESMAAGLPCLVSKNAGACEDLIIEGKTGFLADFSDYQNTIEKINRLLDDPVGSNTIGGHAANFIRENASIEQSVAGFQSCISSIFQGNPAGFCDCQRQTSSHIS